MAMRLNQKARINILFAVCNDAKKDRELELLAEEKRLGAIIYDEAVGKHKEAIYALPSGFFYEHNMIDVAIRVSSKGTDTRGYKSPQFPSLTTSELRYRIWTHHGASLGLPNDVRMPHELHYGQVEIEHGSPLYKQITELEEKWKQLVDDIDTLARATITTLKSMTSANKLMTIYPELADYVIEYCDAGGTQSLAVKPGELDKLMKCATKGDCKKPRRKKKTVKKPDVIVA